MRMICRAPIRAHPMCTHSTHVARELCIVGANRNPTSSTSEWDSDGFWLKSDPISVANATAAGSQNLVGLRPQSGCDRTTSMPLEFGSWVIVLIAIEAKEISHRSTVIVMMHMLISCAIHQCAQCVILSQSSDWRDCIVNGKHNIVACIVGAKEIIA